MVGSLCWSSASPRCGVRLWVLALAMLAASGAHAQVAPAGGQVSTPESSLAQPGDTGVRAHTNIQIFVPERGANGALPPAGGGPGGAVSRALPAPDAKGADEAAQPQ